MASTSPKPNSSTQRPVIAVFCGSSEGTSPAHREAARSIAHALHAINAKLVYGGGTGGLMGELGSTMVSLSGPDSVHGIIPTALKEFEQQYNPGGIDEAKYGRMTEVANMHVRKDMMAKEVVEGGEGSGFIALSGGFGTMEELMEMTTWNQLGIHPRGVVVFNVERFYDGLIQWVKTAVETGFIKPSNGGILKVAATAEECVEQLRNYECSEGRMKLRWDQK
ncbi:MAG: hypothetical protein M1836_004367 [Candelina mexicana]|nr:MAG: hypothetical protein M1836_004367 [Candelina mexicana]